MLVETVRSRDLWRLRARCLEVLGLAVGSADQETALRILEALFAADAPPVDTVAEPSRADELLTQTLKQALSLVEIKTLDHFIVAGTRTVSFAERGLI